MDRETVNRTTLGMLIAAAVVFSTLFWATGIRASVDLDGVRYHYLDDDQMISMRYARNLADGYGPVWNPGGERVEGYTNFGWMLVMSAVHELGASDATASLWVRAINWMLGCAVLALVVRMLLALGLTSRLLVGTAVVTLSLADDLLFWSINGFETTLLTVVFLWALLCALKDGERGALSVPTCLLAGLLPVIRADAADLTAAVVLTAVLLGARRGWPMLALAVVPLVALQTFRVTYYGDWFPNTYYLKVAGRGGLMALGAAHVKKFAATYTVALVCTGAAYVASTDLKVRVLAALVGLGVARVLLVGPDIFPGFRFLAPYVPVLIVVSAVVIARLTDRNMAARLVMAAVLALSTVFSAGVSGRESFADLISTQADPQANTVAGVMLKQTALKDSTVLVAAAGCLPYFSHLPSLDLLGKNDRHVARVAPATAGRTGVNRFDVDWSLRTRPDFVAGLVRQELASQPREILEAMLPDPRVDFVAALLLNDTFIDEYRDNPVPVPFLLRRNPLFVHRDSPERARLAEWEAQEVVRR